MPLSKRTVGTNADLSLSDEYCKYCYQNGRFTCLSSMEEMAEYCSQFVQQYNTNTGKSLTKEEYKNFLLSFFPSLKRWSTPATALPSADFPLKDALISEINILNIPNMPKLETLYVVDGEYVNQEYNVNGNQIQLLDNKKTYWGNQVEKLDNSGRCYGIACDEHYILIAEYGLDGAEAEIILFKKR